MNDIVVKSTDRSAKNLSQIVGTYLANFLSPHTQMAYQNDFKGFAKFLSQSFPNLTNLSDVSSEHVIAFREELRTTMTPNSVNRKLSALSSLFEELQNAQVISANPVRGIKRPPAIPKRPRLGFSDQEVSKILGLYDRTSPQGLNNAALLHFLFYTGARVSEMLSVRVKDVYSESGLWFVHIRGKGDKLRSLPLHPQLATVIQRLIDSQGKKTDSPLFSAIGSKKPLTRRAVSALLKRTLKRLKIDSNRSLHSARRTLISNLLENGAKIESVASAAGHSNVNTTQRYNVRTEKPEASPLLTTRY